MAVEELSVFCHWEEDGNPVKCFLDIVALKKADAESIYLAFVILQEWVLMMLPPFLVKRLVGVQARLKKHAPHAVCPR